MSKKEPLFVRHLSVFWVFLELRKTNVSHPKKLFGGKTWAGPPSNEGMGCLHIPGLHSQVAIIFTNHPFKIRFGKCLDGMFLVVNDINKRGKSGLPINHQASTGHYDIADDQTRQFNDRSNINAS